jgi:predicted nucleic acid-binding protein
MNAKFFLDTNLFVYSLSRSSPLKATRATQLIRQAIVTRNGVVSYQVVQEFFNVALRRFVPPMSAPEAEQYLATVFRPLMAVHSSHALYAEALHLRNRYQLAWHDCVILAGAIEAGCNVLYTEDMQHGQKFGALQIENPFL